MTKTHPRVVAILQARMASQRLPGKVLADLAGQPMLAQILKRTVPARHVDQFVVATTQLPQDTQISDMANKMGVPCFRGASEDCLDRYYQAARQFSADVVVRLTGDNPLVDANFVDWVVQQYLDGNTPYDYVDTIHSKTFPLGLSVEVFSFDALTAAWHEDTNIEWRQHVTTFIHRNPGRFRIFHLAGIKEYSSMRWTVDTLEDLTLVRSIYGHFGHNSFAWQEVFEALDQHPDWLEINRHVEQKTIG